MTATQRSAARGRADSRTRRPRCHLHHRDRRGSGRPWRLPPGAAPARRSPSSASPGSGKSIIALAAMGLLPGNARATGIATDRRHRRWSAPGEADLAALRGRTVSMVFQEPATALDPLTRIGAQIAEVIRNHREVSGQGGRREAVELLRQVGIPEPETRASAYPLRALRRAAPARGHRHGDRQRAALLIADEPTTALDVTVQAEILDLLRELAAESGTGVLLVTHNMGVVADFADRVAVMYQGEIVETGPVEDVLLRPAHDYTKRLLAAVPRLSVARARTGSRRAAVRDATGPRPGGRPPGHLRGVRPRAGTPCGPWTASPSPCTPGETLGLVGESGSGKSTAARVALGLIPPSSGTVSLFGTDLRPHPGPGPPGAARRYRRRPPGPGGLAGRPDDRRRVRRRAAGVHRRGLSAKDRRSAGRRHPRPGPAAAWTRPARPARAVRRPAPAGQPRPGPRPGARGCWSPTSPPARST